MSAILIILLILLLCGGGFGAYNGWYGAGAPYNVVGIVIFVLVLFVIFGLLGGPYHL